MKLKVLLVYNKIWPYRVKIFELLNDRVDLTVGFSDPKYKDMSFPFKTRYMPVRKIGPFEFHRQQLRKFSRNYDVVLGIFNVRWLSLMALCLLRNRKFGLAFWGIGVTASYKNRFDSKSTWDKVRFFISRRSDALIFYSSYPVQKYINAGIPSNKIFVANNTTEVFEGELNFSRKRNFIFVGTLYPQKGIHILLEAYLQLAKRNKNCPLLEIIGDGPERPKIEKFISENELEDKVFLVGSVYKPETLFKHYSNAIACISPNQAGLSVLSSMGNGTLFITEKHAITGGEIFNIENGINGLVYEGGSDELRDSMQWVIDNHEKAVEICKNALLFYRSKRTSTMMVDSLFQAIQFAKSSSGCQN